MTKRVAIVVSHPIQHFCPQYVSFAALPGVHIKVFFGSALGYKKYVDQSFGREISWGNLQLDKFNHCFLNGDDVIKPGKNLDAPNLDNELLKFNPDIIVIYGYFQKLQRRAYHWALKNRKTLAYISDSERRHKLNHLKEFVKFFVLKRYFSRINFFLSVGDANEDFYKYYGVSDERIIRMHFPINVELYEKMFLSREISRKMIRDRFSISETDVCACVVGKLLPDKNQDHIIEALAMLEQEDAYLHLFVVGSGEFSDVLEKKAGMLKRSKVHFVGFVNADELPLYYAASDIYIHPSIIDRHPLAVSEAIYMGCPIIISDTCGSYGNDDDVQHGLNGYVYPFGNIRRLADDIKKLASDRALVAEFSAYSHSIAVRYQKRSHEAALREMIRRLSEHNN